MIAEDVATLNTVPEKLSREVEIDLMLPVRKEEMEQIRAVLEKNRGSCPVSFTLVAPGCGKVRMKAPRYSINPTLECLAALRKIVGVEAVHIQI